LERYCTLTCKSLVGFLLALILLLLSCPAMPQQVHTFQIERKGAKFECTVSLPKYSFLLLERVRGKLWIKNISQETVKFLLSKPYSWTIHDKNSKTCTHPDFSIPPLKSFELKPGDSIGGVTELERINFDETSITSDSFYRNPYFPLGKYTAYYAPDTAPFLFKVIIDSTSKNHLRRLRFYEFVEKQPSGKYFFDTTLGVPIEMEWHDSENVFGKDLIKLSYALMDKHRELFGLEDPSTELKPGYSAGNEISQVFELDQLYNGIPVSGGGIRIHFEHRSKKRYVRGTIHPDIDISPTPRIDKKFAILKALRALKLPSNYKSWTLESSGRSGDPSTSLIIFPFNGEYFLTWRVGIYMDNSDSGWEYFIDANSGKIIHRAPRVQRYR